MACDTFDLPDLAELQKANDNVQALLKTFCDALRKQRLERQKVQDQLKTVERQLSDAGRTQDEITKKYLEDFAAHSLACAKAEGQVRAVLDDLKKEVATSSPMSAAFADSSFRQDNQ